MIDEYGYLMNLCLGTINHRGPRVFSHQLSILLPSLSGSSINILYKSHPFPNLYLPSSPIMTITQQQTKLSSKISNLVLLSSQYSNWQICKSGNQPQYLLSHTAKYWCTDLLIPSAHWFAPTCNKILKFSQKLSTCLEACMAIWRNYECTVNMESLFSSR